MNRFKVRVYVATAFSLLTQADHYEDHYFNSNETLEQILKRLARDGFKWGSSKWIMPGSILTVEQEATE